ncbi:MAG: Ig-like domain-containing protein, partial [Burkholderiales bacterium]
MGSFLLGKNDVLNNDYFMFHGADGEYNAILRYPEYDNIDLGKAVGPYAVTTVGGINVYWREFQKGYVFVNPTANDVPALTLPQAGQQLTHDNLLSVLGSIPVVSTIALPGHNAAVVLKLVSAGDTTPPTVSISSPASGASVGGTFTVSASASDDVGVAGVQFQLDGANLGTEVSAAPYSLAWDTSTASGGSHTLTAVARDTAGDKTTSSPVTVTVSNAPPPDTTPPTVGLTSPASGATVSGSISVTASAADNVGVAGVQFQLDGANLGAQDAAAPYSMSWNTTAASNGSHTLTAVARDAAGNATTSAPVSVVVSNAPPVDTTPPTVAITAPAAGATVSGTLSLTASASDNVGVAGVQFRLDGANLGTEVSAAPYSLAWDTTTASNGKHTLTATARDAAGNKTTSAALGVTVSNKKPARDAANDFNGDGKADIPWRNASTGAAAIWLMNGATAASSSTVATLADANWQIVGVGDLNGDGKADFLWRNATTGQVNVWLMNGASISRSATVATVADANWKIAGVGDFNGDGKADILWRNASTGADVIWFMNGAGIAGSASVATAADASGQVAGVGDFDGDGKADIVWRNATTGQVNVWLMNGASIARSATVATLADANWQVVGFGDFDGDGKADILWRNNATGQVNVWLMNGTSIAGSATVATVADVNWNVVEVGDFNGDGKADILWRNAATGTDIVWFMSGTAITGSAAPNAVAGLAWSVMPVSD